MPQQWIEGRQQVSFPYNWWVIKLDGHRYYKHISGMGIKCVDYLAIDPEWGLYLLELKDYPSKATIPSTDQHEHMLQLKLKGSLKLIKTVNAALRRQWYYRLIFLRLGIYRWCPQEWQTWKLAQDFVIEKKYLIIGDFANE